MTAKLEGVTYRYPGREAPALKDVSVEIDPGELIAVAGSSGGGKSTFLRLFNGLVPQFYGGEVSGRIDVCGLDPLRTPSRQLALEVGLVFQEPEGQSIVETVEDEVAFGMEQHGIPPAEMARRLEDMLEALGIEHLRHRRISTLSGGERQRLAAAAVLALQPRLLLLDEPTSQLDGHGADSLFDAIDDVHRRGDLSILVAEHRLARLLPAATGVIEVESGVVRRLSSAEAARELRSVPPATEFGRRAGLDPLPLDLGEAQAALRLYGRSLHARTRHMGSPGDELLSATGVSVAYGELAALSGASLTICEGEVVALVGPNGSGKSTLFRALAGLIPSSTGEVRLRGQVAPRDVASRTAIAGLVPQDPSLAFYHESVSDEVADTLKARKSPRSVAEAMADWDVTDHAGRDPRDISVGQQERVAIAAMLAHAPDVWLLDEPTRGADGVARAWLKSRLEAHAGRGGAAVVATHDLEAAATWATRVIGLDAGEIAFDLPAIQAFGADGPYPSQIARLVPGALTVEDIAW